MAFERCGQSVTRADRQFRAQSEHETDRIGGRLGGFGDACFGDSSLTIRGQAPVIEGLGGCCWPTPDPVWLAGPYAGAYITPAADLDLGAVLGMYVPPGVDSSALVQGSWVEVVGHFEDAAAATCRRTPLFSPPMGREALHTTQRDCASRFVVESVRAVDGP